MSQIILADAGDIEPTTAHSTPETLSRSQRRALEKAAAKQAKHNTTAITHGEFPVKLARALQATMGPRFGELMEAIADVALETNALIEVLEEKGILTQADVNARRKTIMESMEAAQKAAQQEALNEADTSASAPTPAAVNENSPAFQEATANAGGAKVQRLDEGGVTPSGLVIAGR